MKKEKRNYRIYYVNDKGEDVVVKRFKSVNDKSANKILSKYKKEHRDGKTYYWGYSGNYIGPDRKPYDTLKEMMNNHKKTKYNEESRKLDIMDIEYFIKDNDKKVYSKPVDEFDNLIVKNDEFILDYETKINKVLSLIKETDLKTAPESKMDKITNLIKEINEKKSDIKDKVSLLKHKHSITEEWDITYHILHDLIYNIPILIKTKHGVPGYFLQMVQNVKNPEEVDTSKEKMKEANKLYDKELEKILLYIRLYFFYDDYGIVDKNDKEMVKIYEEYKDTIPYKNGTNHGIDYIKLEELQTKYWNLIWDWMKEYGQMIWD